MMPRRFDRREWIGAAAGAGWTLATGSGWLGTLAAQAPRKPAKSVIALWMDGGPATIDLWDLKPGHENGGPFREIATASPEVRVCEHLPKLAAYGNDLAVLRSMTTREGDHARAVYLLRTGYTPQGGVQFPAVGAVFAHELRSESDDLPSFVSLGSPRYATSAGGFLGPRFDPLTLSDDSEDGAELVVPNLQRRADISDARQAARLDLLEGIERRFAVERSSAVSDSMRAAASRAVRLMCPETAAAFDLNAESSEIRDAYGRSRFGQGVLLARRLVERGVTFVEVTLRGWDTHEDNFERTKKLCGELDAAFSTLLSDLRDRGLLESTIVVCQGEFGRTPKINGQVGRDHWPDAWAIAVAGGGLKTGQSIGRTSADGMAVEDGPTGVPDLIATIASATGIDPMKQNMSNVGRPIRVADPVGRPIEELL